MRPLTWLIAACAGSASCIVDRPLERCNGVDDDHDPATTDGIDELGFGEPCDGPDGDLCLEGTMICRGGELVCNDATGDAAEACNAADDDCDGRVDEGFELATDPANCGACGRTCTNLNGPTGCAAGACEPTCEVGAVDCNGDPSDGCEVFRDRNPGCPLPGTAESIYGDVDLARIEHRGTDEAIFAVALRELSTTATPLTATFSLEMTEGVDFDLYVYCGSCGGAAMASSRNPAGMREDVLFRHRDTPNTNDDQLVFVEVRFVDAQTCGGEWKLRVNGATAVPNVTCGEP